MPQDNLFNDEPRTTGYRLQLEERVLPTGGVWVVTVQRCTDKKGWTTVWVGQWEGVMLDMASSLASETIEAFLYGEKRALPRAAGRVHRGALKHFKAHSF